MTTHTKKFNIIQSIALTASVTNNLTKKYDYSDFSKLSVIKPHFAFRQLVMENSRHHWRVPSTRLHTDSKPC